MLLQSKITFFQERKVKLVPIAIGSHVSVEELKIMAAQEERKGFARGVRNYILVDRFEDLAGAMYDVMDLVCSW